jgi:uncharacterized membrane protein YqhA
MKTSEKQASATDAISVADRDRRQPTSDTPADLRPALGGPMLHFVLSLRWVMLLASVGAALGALLMFVEGASKMLDGIRSAIADHESSQITASVMGATDAFLFGIVLVIFAYSVVFGFVFDLSPENREQLPPWMRAKGVSELKNTLISAVLVYLAVDVTTDFSQITTDPPWQVLVKPASILLIAAAFSLFAASHSDG